ncbi:MAG: hypothetical protein H6825_12035 [Planctomycetes bacterium]|nr:hypothetical protein [Planctomycetota bacterium]
MSKLTALAASLMLLVVSACSTETKAEAPKVLNTKCPMMGEAIDPNMPMSDFHGDKVGYCCDGCQKKFEALSEADKLAKLKAVGADV